VSFSSDTTGGTEPTIVERRFAKSLSYIFDPSHPDCFKTEDGFVYPAETQRILVESIERHDPERRWRHRLEWLETLYPAPEDEKNKPDVHANVGEHQRCERCEVRLTGTRNTGIAEVHDGCS
jgi:hypothetical protein